MYVLYKFTTLFCSIVSITIESSLKSFNLYDNSASTKSYIMVVCAFSLTTSYLSSHWECSIIRYILEQLIDEKVTCEQKYLAKGSKSPSQGSEKSPCKYSARGAKSQPRSSHSADQGKITKQVFPQGKFGVIQKVKATHIPHFNQWESFTEK